MPLEFRFRLQNNFYKYLFWASQLMVMGMLISFPVQGYGLFSIVFSTAHMFLSYAFIYYLIRDLRLRYISALDLPKVFLLCALAFLFVSTLGTWALAYIMNSPLKGSAIYFASIQFFLHFQFNGWFIFALLALFFQFIKSRHIDVDKRKVRNFFKLLLISCPLTYALAVTWSTPDNLLFWTNSAGVLVQLLALLFFVKIVQKLYKQLSAQLEKTVFTLLIISFGCLVVKIVVQSLVAIPHLAVISYTIKNFVLGFIHLLMLGCITSFLLALSYEYILVVNQKVYLGLMLFLAGFFVSEVLLFFQGILLWGEWGYLPYYYEGIALASFLMPMGVLILLMANKSKNINITLT